MWLVRLAAKRGMHFSSTSSVNYLQKSVLSRSLPSMNLVNGRFKATKTSAEEEIDLDAPIKYSTSAAAKWRAHQTFSGRAEEDAMPWYQPIIVVSSVAIFLIYFCILREENDIDSRLDVTLYDRLPGLEETQLLLSLKHGNDEDKPAIERRLAEIRQDKDQEMISVEGEQSGVPS